MPSVRREIVLPVEPDRAWELITDPDELEGWLADEVELDPEEGGDVYVRFEDGEERWGTVEEADPERRLVFVWGGSQVEWTLEEVPGGTRLVIVERSLSPVVGPLMTGPRLAALSAQASLCLA